MYAHVHLRKERDGKLLKFPFHYAGEWKGGRSEATGRTTAERKWDFSRN